VRGSTLWWICHYEYLFNPGRLTDPVFTKDPRAEGYGVFAQRNP
jgi:hypothetical protein